MRQLGRQLSFPLPDFLNIPAAGPVKISGTNKPPGGLEPLAGTHRRAVRAGGSFPRTAGRQTARRFRALAPAQVLRTAATGPRTPNGAPRHWFRVFLPSRHSVVTPANPAASSPLAGIKKSFVKLMFSLDAVWNVDDIDLGKLIETVERFL